MDNQKLLLQALERLEEGIIQVNGAAKTIRAMLNGSTTLEVSKESLKKPKKQSPTTSKSGNKSRSIPAENLGEIPQFTQDDWPLAISPNMIIQDKGEPERKFRALQISAMISTPLEGKNVLDFGCGQGHVTKELSRKAANIVGYDIVQDEHWDEHRENVIFTNNNKTMTDNGPYDFILIYDVLDHLVGEDPTVLLRSLHGLLSDEGSIFIRTHPWTSKHGGHLYEQVNKAYLHLALTTEELLQNGMEPQHNLKISRPMAAYEKWIKDAGLIISDRKLTADKVDPFFDGEILERIINITWGGNIEKEQALKIMANQFIDYILTK